MPVAEAGIAQPKTPPSAKAAEPKKYPLPPPGPPPERDGGVGGPMPTTTIAGSTNGPAASNLHQSRSCQSRQARRVPLAMLASARLRRRGRSHPRPDLAVCFVTKEPQKILTSHFGNYLDPYSGCGASGLWGSGLRAFFCTLKGQESLPSALGELQCPDSNVQTPREPNSIALN